MDDALVFTHSRRVTVRVQGPPERLLVLVDVLGEARLLPEDLRGARMPANLESFAAHLAERQDEIDELLDVGRRLVEAVERLVCGLYGLPDELTDLVIESAVTRSGTVAERDE